ncbi:SDR family NAD(P)-dependent oxidoreductase [Asanoa sp. WMMD1127]|uniref:SDR family oxidoreductase n=1 Tax=Asanoa sp. WMMD1127 TaxID=3016107 RepID=UPI002415E510|nr:SDR family NAD(P)-dependent oxidoreductase [Asanoa sp. WMMD1127]MDG4821361.1 SDR family NAD(P)-dependent oxidoreductase [Asanoa sp. WMMD1127]
MTVTLITGGSAGIGAATARQLLALGQRVAVTGRRADKLNRFADDNPEALTLVSDSGVPAEVQAAVDSTVGKFGRLDNIVANAGYATHDGLDDGDPDGWRDMVLTNVLGPAALIRAALPHLAAARGRIVLVGSVAGLLHTPGNIYGATKWALTGLAGNTRQLVSAKGIGVTLVSPGGTETDFFGPIGGPPADRPGGYLTADQVAASIVWALNQPEGVDISTITMRRIGSPV